MGAPLRSVSLLTIWGPPQTSIFFACYREATSDQFHHKIYRGPSDQFLLLLYGAPLRLVSSLTIWGPSDHFLCILFGGPSQISVFSCYMGPPQISFLHIIWSPLRSVLCILYGGPSDQFLRLLYRGPPEISFFAYYMRASLRSVSSLTIWQAPLDQFLRILLIFRDHLKSAF